MRSFIAALRSLIAAFLTGVCRFPPFSYFKRRMRLTTTRLCNRKPLWVYEHARSLDELHGKNLAKFNTFTHIASVKRPQDA